MYEEFYGFSRRPFSLLPDATFFFSNRKHDDTLNTLQGALSNQFGFCVVTGEIGAGKTTISRKLVDIIRSDYHVGVVSNTHEAFGDLISWIASAFELPLHDQSRAELHQAFVEHVKRVFGKGKRTVLVVDEAQNLSVAGLEELRILANINTDAEQMLQIVLIGQLQLRERLNHPDLEQFKQRIVVHHHLGALDHDECLDYIRFRTACAKGDPGLFTDEACTAVYHCSGGIPRLINRLCDTALLYGHAESCPVVGIELVAEAIKDQQAGVLSSAIWKQTSAAPDTQPPLPIAHPGNDDTGSPPTLVATGDRQTTATVLADTPTEVEVKPVASVPGKDEETIEEAEDKSRLSRRARWIDAVSLLLFFALILVLVLGNSNLSG